MRKFMRRAVVILFVLAIIDAALIVGNLMGNSFPWLKATIIGAAMVIFACGLMIGGACERATKRGHKHPSTPHIVEKK